MPWYEAIVKITAIAAAFAIIHSLMVAGRVKALFARAVGEAAMKASYRLIFTLISVVATAGALYLIIRLPDSPIFIVGGWPRWVMRALQALGAAIGLMAFKVFDAGEFLGLSQALRYIRGIPPAGDIEGLTCEGLITSGIYGVVRNPLYLAGIMICTFNPDITRNRLTISILADCYLIFGALIEQRRMIARFGDECRIYMKRVPLLMPRLRRSRNIKPPP